MQSFIITPAFCKAKMLKGLMQQIYEPYDSTVNFRHVVLYNHYPVDEEKNRAEIEEICKHYEVELLDSGGDIGLHRSLNKAVETLGIDENDTVIGCDPDDRPSRGAFGAMREVMTFDRTLGILGVNFWVIPWKKNQGAAFKQEQVAGRPIWVHPSVEMWNVAAFNMKMIKKMGGFHQPNAYYGGLEVAIYENMKKDNLRLAYLMDHSSEAVPVDREDPELFDKSYGDWKVAHAHKGFKGSYKEWLNK